MLEQLKNELLLILVRVDQIVRIEVVVVLPDEHLPQPVPEAHAHVLLLVILLDRPVVAVDDVGFLEHVEELHVQHVAVHSGVFDACGRAWLQAAEGLEVPDDLLVI